MTTTYVIVNDNSPNFVYLDLYVDDGFDTSSFLDLVFSFRHNYTLQHLTVIRKSAHSTATGEKKDSKEEQRQHSGSPMVQRRSHKELRMLLVEIFKLPKLTTLDFENFHEDEFDEFGDLFHSASRVQ